MLSDCLSRLGVATRGEQDELFDCLPFVSFDGGVNLSWTEFVHALALEGVAAPIRENGVNVQAVLGVPGLASAVHVCVRIKLG